jgi:acetyltransferase-like isoleucine patch superfamily enzyme
MKIIFNMTKRLILVFYVLIGYIKFKNKANVLGENIRTRGPFKIFLSKNAKLVIGNNFSLISGLMLNPLGRNLKSCIRIDEHATIIIGDNVGMSCVTLWAKKEIVIGNNVKLGADVLVLDSDMHAIDYEMRRNIDTDSVHAASKKIHIGNDVFIGTRSIICKGVTIGDRSIVGAGSIVVTNIPQDEIWGGNPAKFIKKLN